MRVLDQLLVTMCAAALAAAGCSKARPLEGGQQARVAWEEEVAPLFAADCNSCHSGAAAAAGYRTTSYLEALGPKGARVAVAGDGSSKLLQTIDPDKADATHQPVSAAFNTVRSWVVDGRLAFFRSQIHAGGILNPDDPDEFHGAVLRRENWNFSICQKCHGADFTGGSSGVSCTQCHAQQAGGPTSCTTCHGQPPQSGAHQKHVVTAGLDCTECHVKPKQFDDPGHLTGPDGKAKDKATVTFGSRAALGTPRAGAPAWDGSTCSNIYCHGATLQDAKASSTTPSWTGTAACGSCHGAPPANHNAAWTSCIACHQRTVLATGASPKLSPVFHANGTVEVGSGANNCASCHGTGQSTACGPGAPCSAPPRDLSSNQSETALGVGAHQAHLVGKQNLSGDIPCSACHVVPNSVDDPGHIDHPLPATVTFSGLAQAESAAPAWDHASATCSATYCHGGGANLAADTAFGLRKPVWNLGSSQAYCGSCHGLPPSTTAHAGVRYPDCARCHPATVAPNGAIIVSGAPGARTSTHINGVIDVTP